MDIPFIWLIKDTQSFNVFNDTFERILSNNRLVIQSIAWGTLLNLI